MDRRGLPGIPSHDAQIARLILGVSFLSLFTLGGCVVDAVEPASEEQAEHERWVRPGELLSQWRREGNWLVSPPTKVENGANRVGLLAVLREAGEMPRFQAQVAAGSWADIETTWSEEDHHVGSVTLRDVGTTAHVRIAAIDAERVWHLRWHASLADVGGAEEPTPSESQSTSSALSADLAALGVVSRSEWGARATRCTSRDSTKTRMAIHHTVTGQSDPARQLRGIQRYHMDSRGWCDVGYHFLIGADGVIYEGRPLAFLGTHVGGNNTGNIGISFIGCFHTSGCSGLGATDPSPNMLDAAARLVGELARQHDITISATTVKGHRDHSGQSTSCPGDNLHRRIADIRRGAVSSPPPGSSSCRHTFGGSYEDRGCSAGYQCCNGTWQTRGRCGACSCVETTGTMGCASPPPGSSCVDTYGARYANTACPLDFQCCDGRWRSLGTCGACFCRESHGSFGCGITL